MIPLIGYSDRLSARPGERVAFKVSSAGPAPFEARLVRIVSADPNPAGPGIIEEAIEAAFAGSYPSRRQPIPAGSHARVADAAPLRGLASLTLLATVWPTTPGKGEQGILARLGGAGRGFALMIGAGGRLTARLGGATSVSLKGALAERRWYRVWAAYDAEHRSLTVGQRPLEPAYGEQPTESASATAGNPAPEAVSDLLIAALGGDPVAGCFDGKIEAPALYGRALAPDEIERAAAGEDLPGLVARWDFSRGIPTTRVEDTGPHGLHGALVNLPARAMTGAAWDGSEMCWRHAPEHYGAIHFHDDDVADFGWETDFAFTVPDDLPSGVYAARLTCGDHRDSIPFFVCPPRGERRAALCVLVSTFTYVIYGNYARRDFGQPWRDRSAQWNAYPWNPADHREYGLSTYNFHGDGSGICHASHLRPLLSLRPGYLTFGEGPGSGLRHFQADSHLIAWLEAKGIAYDIVTDRELHDEGAALLEGYAAVTTGSHPEYHTKETLDALTGYRDRGGHLLYLGGNGFYWRVALHGETPGVLEIRRGEGGIRAWAAEPGEYYNAFDGAYGGLWRRNGRPPQRLAGVGFSAQGLFDGSYYRRTPAAEDPRVAWILAGIDDELLGDFGLSGGGAAGFELDRFDPRLGSPPHALVIASSEGHGDGFVLVPEEHLTHVATWPGAPPDELIRADMTYFETPSGGAVFSTGSITFCGSLPHNDFDNNISRLLENVVRRFLAEGWKGA